MNIPHRCSMSLCLALSVVCAPATAATADGPVCRGQSGPARATLIELFTSEGCSSCPPAEQWVSRQVAAHPQGVIPLSLHVTYWDDLGWRDRYGDPEFDRRQQWYARFASHHFAYTPELFRNGVEWQDWRDAGPTAQTPQPAGVLLSMTFDARAASTGTLPVHVNVAAASGLAPAVPATRELRVFAYQDGLRQQPDAGELRGASLRHDHVVRAWTAVPAAGTGRDYALQLSLPADARGAPVGVVALLQDRDTGEVIQALDLPACAP